MKHTQTCTAFLILSIVCLILSGCKKFLDEKSSKSLVVPSTLQDLQALLDAYPKMNNNDPASGEVSADDYYLNESDFNSLTDYFRRMYTWEKDFLFLPSTNDWAFAYEPVYVANTVLDVITRIENLPTNAMEWNNVKGQALYFRAKSFLQAVLIWSKAYDSIAASADLGIPLRLGTDFNEPSVRATVQQSYDRIIRDLTEAIPLLPITPVSKTRPSRPAAYGLLARTFLAVGNYSLAGLYADSCLQLYNTLLNYNSISATPTYPFVQFNAEVISQCRYSVAAPIVNSRARIDSLLYRSYAANDLRKTLFFLANTNGTFRFRGSYEGNSGIFHGIATDEMYLVRAEARAKLGNVSGAMNDLNTLLINRWKTGTFIPFAATTSSEALDIIRKERRKELVMRGLRWMDIKRWNREGAAIGLTRIIGSSIFTLPPNDLRFALPIPEDIIERTGMPQNPR